MNYEVLCLIDNVFDLIYDRRKAENDISSLADPIINYLIKIKRLCYEAKKNCQI